MPRRWDRRPAGCGPPGVGKTTAAAELSRSGLEFAHRRWVPAGGSLVESLHALAAELGIDGASEFQLALVVRDALGAASLLIVVDDVSARDDVGRLVSALGGADLLVSTGGQPDTRIGGQILELRGLRESEIEHFVAQWRRAASESRAALGDSHPSTLSTDASLAAVLMVAGRAEEAVELLRQLTSDSAAVLGPNHPSTLAALSNLSEAYWTLGLQADALEVLALTLARTAETHGPQHPTTLALQADLDLLTGPRGG